MHLEFVDTHSAEEAGAEEEQRARLRCGRNVLDDEVLRDSAGARYYFFVVYKGHRNGSSQREVELETLNKADAAWRLYRAQVCNLQFDYFTGGGGTIAVPARADCELRLDRAYMQQLEGLLHLQQVVR